MLALDEVFLSIQGESSDAGLPCIFVRLHGCPIHCVYCDTNQDHKKVQRVTIEKIVGLCSRYKWCKNVCITGGEPLIQEDTIPLTMELMQIGYKVAIETSGCIPIDVCGYRRSYKYIMDVKGPSSEVEDKNIYENLLHLQFNDEVKYLIRDRVDYDFMKKIMRKYPTSAKILVGPLYSHKNKPYIGKELVNWVLEDKLNVRIDIQLHKFLGCS